MPLADFIHLRVHTAYSLSAGAIKVKELVGLCKANQMPAVAITDSGNLFGALEFATSCAEAGCSRSSAARSRWWRTRSSRSGSAAVALTPNASCVLVQSEIGYRNLLALVSRSFLESDAAPSRRSRSPISGEQRGVAVPDRGRQGSARPADRRRPGCRRPAFCSMRSRGVSRPALYRTDPARHRPRRRAPKAGLIDLAYKHDLPLVATNDCYFPDREFYEAHDALMCIAQGKVVDDRTARG